MNLSGKLFSGSLALALIVLACIAPLYIADKWKDIETSGSSLIHYSEIFTNNTLEYVDYPNPDPDYIPYLELNNSNKMIHRWGQTAYCCRGTFSGSTWNYLALDPALNFNGLGYYDTVTPDTFTTYSYSLRYGLKVNINDMISNGANIIKISWISDDAYRLGNTKFVKSSSTTTTVTGYASWAPLDGNYCRNNATLYFELSPTDLTGLQSFYAAGPTTVFGLSVELVFYDADNYPAVSNDTYFDQHPVTTSIEILNEYYEEILTVTYSETEEIEHTMYVGSDVKVSYMDIQKWILGASGVGIGILALASSPFWNPIQDYHTPINGGKKWSRKKPVGRGRGRRKR